MATEGVTFKAPLPLKYEFLLQEGLNKQNFGSSVSTDIENVKKNNLYMNCAAVAVKKENV